MFKEQPSPGRLVLKELVVQSERGQKLGRAARRYPRSAGEAI
jgi:hypothetical protein